LFVKRINPEIVDWSIQRLRNPLAIRAVPENQLPLIAVQPHLETTTAVWRFPKLRVTYAIGRTNRSAVVYW